MLDYLSGKLKYFRLERFSRFLFVVQLFFGGCQILFHFLQAQLGGQLLLRFLLDILGRFVQLLFERRHLLRQSVRLQVGFLKLTLNRFQFGLTKSIQMLGVSTLSK